MIRYVNRCVWLSLLLIGFLPDTHIRCDDLTDTRKKEMVEQLYAEYKKDLPNVKEIQPAEVMRLMKHNAIVLIDVRTPEEMNISMLPGAITENDYLKNVDAYKGLTAVAYCTIGSRSGMFAKKMAKKGVEVKNLAGGILAWVFDGGRVYHQQKEVKRIHVYGSRWDYLPAGYTSVRFGLFERLFMK